MARAAALIIRDGHVALIERRPRGGRGLYYLFPGGGIEAGESPAAAATREVAEELGLLVAVRQLVAEVFYKGSVQLYFAAEVLGGTFGTGWGAEMLGQVPPEAGAYRPVWLPVDDLLQRPVYPRAVAALVAAAAAQGWPAQVLTVEDRGQT